MNKVKNILIAGILSICMIASSLPVELLAQEVENPQEESLYEASGESESNGENEVTEPVDENGLTESVNEDKETEPVSENVAENIQKQTLCRVVSFEELSDDIKVQSVALETPLEELVFPSTLMASCSYYEDNTQPDKPGTEDGGKDSGDKPDTEDGDADSEDKPDAEDGDEDSENEPDTEDGDTDSEDKPDTEDDDADSEDKPSTGNGGTDSEDKSDTGNGGTDSGNKPDTENGGTDSGNKPDTGNGGTDSEDKSDTGNGDTDSGNNSDAGNGGTNSEDKPNTENSGTDSGNKPNTENSGTDSGNKPDTENSGSKPQDNSVIGNGKTEQKADLDVGNIETKSEEKTAGAEVKTGSAEIKQETVTVRLKEYHSEPEYINDIKTLSVQTVTIDVITWVSFPEYDGETAGSYVFIPMLPAEYIIEEGVKLPEIVVNVGGAEELDILEEAEPSDSMEGTPGCGTIDHNTTWDGGVLTDGTLTINSGVALTITDVIVINGNVTIEGGGKILRGKSGAYFQVNPDAALTLGNITVDGTSMYSAFSMIRISNASVILNDGCVIQNCAANNGGAVYMSAGSNVTLNAATIKNCSAMNGGAIASMGTGSGSIVLNNATIENCSARAGGGAVWSTVNVTINGGNYKNNITQFDTNVGEDTGGGFINISGAILSIYGGNFIGNTAANKGGCIYQCADAGSAVYLYGGYFKDNTCSYDMYKGSGAVYSSLSGSDLHVSGNVQFNQGESQDSGIDGIYLDSRDAASQKVLIDDTLNSPITLYGRAAQNRVIAEGRNGYVLLQGRDMNKISFVNTAGDGEHWYMVLDKDENNIKLSLSGAGNADKFFIYYMSNGAEGMVTDSNNDDEGYNSGDSVIVKSGNKLSMEGKAFLCWNTAADGSGDPYNEGDSLTITGDINLYAIFTDAAEKYWVEHYKQTMEGNGYEKVESDTVELMGIIGNTVTAEANLYAGYTENTLHESRLASGVIREGEMLVLRLYYDRNTYRISFDLNDGSGNILDTKVLSCGEKLEEPIPELSGYSFKGWYKEDNSRWDFDAAVENNTTELSATLYAKWVDDIAPVLEEAYFNEGYKDFSGWIIRKKDLVITVPITEEGSGVNRVNYTLTPENGEEPTRGEIRFEETYAPRQLAQTKAVFSTQDGQVAASITVSSDYKGTVAMECIDNVGNTSQERILTVADGGIIVEDNAPAISFDKYIDYKGRTVVKVAVADDEGEGGNRHVTGGIAKITYQIDDKTEHTIGENTFEDNMVSSYTFSVKVLGVGKHNIKVTAIDNAGNSKQNEYRVKVVENNKSETISDNAVNTQSVNDNTDNNNYHERKIGEFTALVQVDKPDMPKDNEPDTGDDSIQVEIYATVAMIAGMFYLLLYFGTGKNGMTEEEKNEFVSRLISWAKRGSKFRRFVAITAIFLVLFYYHSIGKRVSMDWKKVYEK